MRSVETASSEHDQTQCERCVLRLTPCFFTTFCLEKREWGEPRPSLQVMLVAVTICTVPLASVGLGAQGCGQQWHGTGHETIFSMRVSGRTRDHAGCVASFALNTLVMISHWTVTKSHCAGSWTRKKPLTRGRIWLQAKYHRSADCTLGHSRLE